MRRLLCWGAALPLLLAAAAPARAGVVDWSYSWSTSPNVIGAASGGSSGLNLFAGASGSATTGADDIIAAQFEAFGPVPAKFTNAGYSVTMHITDNASGKSGTLTFTGLLNGTVSSETADLTNKISSLTSQMLNLGESQYTVTLGSFTLPGPPGSGVMGSLAADVIVSGAPVPEVPEPATALLAGIGLAMAGLKCWRSRRRR